ncbi:hemagglutinin [Campylobacter jejuni]|nr:hemagglutinin [Campylobacter jejuni]EDP5575283.1 hemagglutinin [Campylobacter jejuni]EED1983458.1 hemagglutinin [Campylobacter jejuni]EEP3532949.1 hemagglutinin [Campylobacter jejuni]EEP3621638.1 hemagglutinin [Campylobacter jejuni]
MNISGSKTNSVIQWGGGFNIASGETVNFGQGKTNQNYLNIAYAHYRWNTQWWKY